MTQKEKEELRALVVSAVAEATAPLERKIDALRDRFGDALLDTRSAAKYASTSRSTIHRRVSEGTLRPATPPGVPYKFTTGELDRALGLGIL